jgi:hypothetical protein
MTGEIAAVIAIIRSSNQHGSGGGAGKLAASLEIANAEGRPRLHVTPSLLPAVQ